MSDPLFDIALAAADLKLGMPDQFEKLLESFRLLDQKTYADLLAADQGGILAAQGKAQLTRQLRLKLETCVDVKNKALSDRK